MNEVINANIADLIPDSQNANKHTQKGMRLLEKSISKLGFGRSILLDKDNNIIAGNGVVETCGAGGLENVRIIETDGNEIIAVRRKDVSIDSKIGRELALADNQTAKAGIDFDMDVIADLSEDFGVDFTTEWEMEFANYDTNTDSGNEDTTKPQTLAEKFLMPPFSVLNARSGEWQNRKRQWLALGIKSELGRGGGITMNDHEWMLNKLGKIQATH